MTRAACAVLMLVSAALTTSAHAHDFDDVRPITAEVTAWTQVAAARGGRPIDSRALMALAEVGDRRGGLALSPDGRRAAFMLRRADIGSNLYHYTLVVVDLNTGAHAALATAGGMLLESRSGRLSGGALARQPLWSASGRRLAYIAEVEGRAELWRIDITSGRAARSADLPGDVARFGWNGETLHVETRRPRAGIAAARLATERSGFFAGPNYEPGYRQDAMIDDAEGGAVYAIEEGGLRPPSEAVFLDPIRVDPARIEARDETSTIAMPEMALRAHLSGATVTCASPLCSGAMQEAWTADGGGRVYFTRLEAGGAAIGLYRWTLRSGAVDLIWTNEGRLDGCAIAPTRLACLHDAPGQPRRLVSFDLTRTRQEPRVIYDANPGWSAFALPRIDRLSVRDSDGNLSFAHLVYPLGWRAGRRYPLVLVQYRSRGFLFGGTGRDAPVFPFSARNFFVLSIDRPEAETLGRTLSLTEVQRQTEFDGTENAIKVAAIEALIASCVQRGLVDRSRVGATGMSDGAETVYAMLDRGLPLAAAAVSTPPLDPFAWALMSDAFRQSQIDRFSMGAPWNETPNAWTRRWRRESSFYHAGHYTTPLMLNLSESEVLFAMPFVRRLQHAGAPVDLYVYPGAYHNKSSPSQLMSHHERVLAWMNLWLVGQDTPSTSEPERAARWRDYTPSSR